MGDKIRVCVYVSVRDVLVRYLWSDYDEGNAGEEIDGCVYMCVWVLFGIFIV